MNLRSHRCRTVHLKSESETTFFQISDSDLNSESEFESEISDSQILEKCLHLEPYPPDYWNDIVAFVNLEI